MDDMDLTHWSPVSSSRTAELKSIARFLPPLARCFDLGFGLDVSLSFSFSILWVSSSSMCV